MNKLLLPVAILVAGLAGCNSTNTPLSTGTSGGSTGGGTGGGPTNSAPTANADAFTVESGSSNNLFNVLANDSDADGDTFALTTFPTTTQSGTLSRDTNGTANDQTDDVLRYTPNGGITSGTDSFTYTIEDSNGATATATVSITIQEAANPPPGVACRDRDARLTNNQGFCFDAEFNTAHDGTKIDMTVYVPHPNALAAATPSTLAAGEFGFAPFVIHGHGFGGSKEDDFENNLAHFVDNQTAVDLWNAGYFVVSFSERGFGQSGGSIGFMTPELEGQDINELLDWAIKHLRGESSAGAGDSIYDFTFDAANTAHTSSVNDATDTRPSLLMNDNNTRLQIGAAGADGNPAVGTLGYSYGGGFQYTASHADTDDISPRPEQQRFDALIPEGTWHDLRYSLNANDVPKGYWATLLFGFAIQGGTLANGTPTPQCLQDIYSEAVTTAAVSPRNQNFLGQNSASHYCDAVNGTTTNAALFHIQGVRDTLFDFNDGFENAQCFAKAGNDVRYLAVSGGHPLTVTQQTIYTGNTTSMDIDEVFHCDTDGDGVQERFITKDLMFAWFEEKLRGQANAADMIPNVCIAQENTDPNDFLEDPNYHGTNASFGYLKEGVVYNSLDEVLIGAGTAPNYTCDGEADAQCEVNVTLNVGGSGPASNAGMFVPLYTVADNRTMVGIPTVKLEFASANPAGGLPLPISSLDTTIFIGTAIERDGSTYILHDQITPVRGSATYPYTDVARTVTNPATSMSCTADPAVNASNVVTENGNPISYGCGMNAESLCDRGRLAGITTRLLPGDKVGLMFSGGDVQYQQIVNAPNQIVITGDVEFPILGTSPLPNSNN